MLHGWLHSVLAVGCTTKPDAVEQNALQVIDQLEAQDTPSSELSSTPSTIVSSTEVDSVSKANVEPIYPNLSFIGLSDLHINYFSELSIVDSLAKDLGPFVNEGVDMEVEFNDNAGFIRIFHNRPQTALNDLKPIGEALGSYRHNVAARFDLRVLSFSVEIVVGKCRFSTLADSKLSGAFLSPCYHFGREIEPECGEYSREGLKFSSMQDSQIATCLANP